MNGRIAIGSDNLVRLDLLTDASSGSYIEDATLSFQLLGLDGTVILDTIAMAYVAASNGRYEGTIPASTSTTLSQGTNYIIAITAVKSGTTLLRRVQAAADYSDSGCGCSA